MNNTQRILFVDLARGIAVLCMIFAHVMELFPHPQLVSETIGGYILGLLGMSPAAPVFMVLMGFSIAISKQKPLDQQVKRGASLIFKGYVLNILRFVIPMIIATLLLENESINLYGIESNPTNLFLVLDILQFAGLAIVLTSIAAMLPIYISVMSIVAIAFISPYLWGLHTNLPVVNHMLDFLWGTKENYAFFPLFPWLIYPLAGSIIGRIFKSSNNKKHFFTSLLYIGIASFLIGISIFYLGLDNIDNYYNSNTGSLTFHLGFVLIWLRLCQNICSTSFVSTKLFSLFAYWSKHVNTIYFIQWTIITWGLFLFEYKLQTWPTILALLIGYSIASHLILLAINKIMPLLKSTGNTRVKLNVDHQSIKS